MRELDNNAHSAFLLYYHLIMVTKYRRKVFDEQISARGKRSSNISHRDMGSFLRNGTTMRITST